MNNPKERQELPTVVVFNTLVDRILAHPGLFSTGAGTVQSRFHVHAALVRSLALTHDQRLGHIAGHAPIEAAGCPLASIGAAAFRRAGLENRRQVAVANRITNANLHAVRAGSSTAVH